MFTTMMGVFKMSHLWGRRYYDIKPCRCSTCNNTRHQKQCENSSLFWRYNGSHSGSAEQHCGLGSLDTERTCRSRKPRKLGPWSHLRRLSHGGLRDPLGSGPQPQTAYVHVWIRICLPTQGPWVRFPVLEDPTGRGVWAVCGTWT